MSNLLIELKSMFEDHTGALPSVSIRRLFGCDGFFRDGTMFGLIWKTGRIALKLRADDTYNALLSLPGAEPWSPSRGKAMSGWVMVPEGFHDDQDALAQWIRTAHAEAPPKVPASASGLKPAKAKKPAATLKAAKQKKLPATKKPAKAPRRPAKA